MDMLPVAVGAVGGLAFSFMLSLRFKTRIEVKVKKKTIPELMSSKKTAAYLAPGLKVVHIGAVVIIATKFLPRFENNSLITASIIFAILAMGGAVSMFTHLKIACTRELALRDNSSDT